MERYNRADVLRILRITARQLAGWEKSGLFPVGDSYSFFDLLQIKKLRDLRAKRVRSAVIRDSLRAMLQQVAGMENPLLEAGGLTCRSSAKALTTKANLSLRVSGVGASARGFRFMVVLLFR